MVISGFAKEGDVGREGHIAGDFGPEIVKIVLSKPHVRAAAGDCVALLGWVVLR
jgi:hypothetical protein